MMQGQRTPGLLRASWLVLATLAVSASPLTAQKTDVVTIQNGDAITGEIKQLDRGRLEYGTDDMGTIQIEWDKIVRLVSVWYFEVEQRSGRRYYGTFLDGAEAGTLIVALPPRRDTLPLGSIVRITPIEATFWQRLDGYIDVGFSYAKANQAINLTTSGRANYRGRKWGGSLSAQSYFQKQDTVGTTSGSVELSLDRYLGEQRWAVGLFTSAEQNEVQNLALRGRLGASVGRSMVHTNSSILRLTAGLSVSSERHTEDGADAGIDAQDTTSANVEGLLQFEWAVFRFDSPELDILTKINTYPSLTDFGRVVSDGEVRVQYEVIKDFFLGFNVTANLDSRPPSGVDAEKLDFRTEVTLGWSF
jgi:hypothetical protein